MKFSKSILSLFAEFKGLPFGKYIIEIYYDSSHSVKEFCFANYTEHDGLMLHCCEFFSTEDIFDYEIYSETFMKEAFRFYNHEMEMNL